MIEISLAKILSPKHIRHILWINDDPSDWRIPPGVIKYTTMHVDGDNPLSLLRASNTCFEWGCYVVGIKCIYFDYDFMGFL